MNSSSSYADFGGCRKSDAVAGSLSPLNENRVVSFADADLLTMLT